MRVTMFFVGVAAGTGKTTLFCTALGRPIMSHLQTPREKKIGANEIKKKSAHKCTTLLHNVFYTSTVSFSLDTHIYLHSLLSFQLIDFASSI